MVREIGHVPGHFELWLFRPGIERSRTNSLARANKASDGNDTMAFWGSIRTYLTWIKAPVRNHDTVFGSLRGDVYSLTPAATDRACLNRIRRFRSITNS
ncbi:protein of unknown function [Methylocaldum szegediense]|uniref:Uncharacterized protein n=1 Tax=Methylocaldum szegediense TaxID=73780 RepID=A0ABN8X316_9GAMM|nr:protein of unknown function [Methylocaldum szegediense]